MADYARRLLLAQQMKPFDKARSKAAAAPFRDDVYMYGPPNCSATDFETPRLRQCPFDPATINWKLCRRLGGGLDGYVWKVRFGESECYALKVFWDAEAPDFHHYFAAQRECQNAALVQMMEEAVHQAAAKSVPIMVNAKPTSKNEALANVQAFSNGDHQLTPDQEKTPLLSVPRMRKCYGWLNLDGDTFRQMPSESRAPQLEVNRLKRILSPDKEYIAIVYEYIEDGENVPTLVEEVSKFLWLAGFCHTNSPRAENWKSSVLIDLSDIIWTGGYGWHRKLYGSKTADMLLVP